MELGRRSVISTLNTALASWIDEADGAADRSTSKGVERSEIVAIDLIDERQPALASVRVETTRGGRTYTRHALVAVGDAAPACVGLSDVIGTAGQRSEVVVWDALADPDALVRIAAHVVPGLAVSVARREARSRWATTVVFDETWEATFFSEVIDGPHPEAAMSDAMARSGFSGVTPSVATWSRRGTELALVRRWGGSGRTLVDLIETAVTSTLGAGGMPGRPLEEIAGVVESLGATVADMHVASALAFGTTPLRGSALADELTARLAACDVDAATLGRLARSHHRLTGAHNLGMAITVHGSLGADRVRYSGNQWLMADCGRVGPGGARRPSSPLADVASVVASIGEALDRCRRGDDPDADIVVDAWDARLSESFVTGYNAVSGIAELLPPDAPASDALLRVFELDAEVRSQVRRHAQPPISTITLDSLDRVAGDSAMSIDATWDPVTIA